MALSAGTRLGRMTMNVVTVTMNVVITMTMNLVIESSGYLGIGDRRC
jgi:hypothetical protein